MSAKSAVVHVRLDEDTRDWLDGVCSARHTKVSVYLRELIEEKRAGQVTPEAIQPSNVKAPKRRAASGGATLEIALDDVADQITEVLASRIRLALQAKQKELGKPKSSDDFTRSIALDVLIDALSRM
jgi:predicted transcriptional regulator